MWRKFKGAGQNRCYPNRAWPLDEVFVRIIGKRRDRWRAVDHEGEILETYVTKGAGPPSCFQISA
ncbi:DDE-type integrase/transposase/recombinase [Aestuariispira ectoiniformans]|uniref:DDE-type integrase/transposase/recombinase n=1 Tax=Aestuariispira ectoiniformans TaxID=2775080 RepID=UPI0035CCECF0